MGKRRKISKTKYVKTTNPKRPSRKEPEEEPEEEEEEERPIPAPLRQSPDVKIFVAEPMIDKPVTDISGIGSTLGRKLALSGFDKAYVVLGQYLVLKKNRRLFIKWLRDEFNAPVKCARDCYTCLTEWCSAYL